MNIIDYKMSSNLRVFDCSNSGINKITESIDCYTHLDCSVNQIRLLPKLSDVLQILSCQNNKLIRLPRLPKSLKLLDCSMNQIRTLTLPENLEQLNADNNFITKINKFPSTLNYISLEFNELIELPELPSNLQTIHVANNRLVKLPKLPEGLNSLCCHDNPYLTELPDLPQSLEYLCLSGCGLTRLPKLPGGLKSLHCAGNELIELPELPEGLQELFCPFNNLQELPRLPSSLIVLNCYENNITEMPDISHCDNLREALIDRYIFFGAHAEILLGTNQTFYEDAHNVHDREIQKSMIDAVAQLRELSSKYPYYKFNQEEVYQDKRLSEQSLQALDKLFQNEDILMSIGLNYQQVFILVWSVIRQDDNAVSILNTELPEIGSVCLVGAITSTINCLSGIYVNVSITDKQQIGNFIIHHVKKLSKDISEDQLSSFKQMCITELSHQGYDQNVIQEYLDVLNLEYIQTMM
jgi:hypothetical protein